MHQHTQLHQPAFTGFFRGVGLLGSEAAAEVMDVRLPSVAVLLASP